MGGHGPSRELKAPQAPCLEHTQLTLICKEHLGLADDQLSARAEYQEEFFEISLGDVILLMADGLPARLNPRDENLDTDHTRALPAESAEGTPEAIVERLLQAGEEWSEGRPLDDDIALVVLKAK